MHRRDIRWKIKQFLGIKNLYDYAEKGDIVHVRDMLQRGSNPDKRGGLWFDNELTALHIAVKKRHYEIIKLLLSKGANVNARTNYGESPLHLAVQRNSFNEQFAVQRDIAELLIINGVDVNARDNGGETALHIAARTSSEMIDFLLLHNADICVEDNRGITPLHLAAFGNRLNGVILLLNHGAEINAKTKYGYGLGDDSSIPAGSTPLNFANMNRSSEVYEYLRSKGGII